ncbi:hypothetical protein KP509_10G044900 [Ceratopteris richardii]|uniref:Reduced epidermal fluorescence 4 n=1 Tax=Ceratopteris richardii TaxID=49495 RepID=A0A8T2TYV0_CERRI|nr:hypothetical protein KP509_10G044900 [Ceratopteris richardii]KAH7427461.1 hypothetical protein KP509_10G044900 [Ceratopteris richardii]
MEAAEGSGAIQKVLNMTKFALERGESPLLWSIEAARCLQNASLEIPSAQLGNALASFLFSCSSIPVFCSYLNHAMSCNLVSSFHVIGLITSRALQSRRSRPDFYYVFLELTSIHVINLGHTKAMPCCDMVVKAVDEVLQLSVLSGVPISNFGTAAVQYLLILFWRLLEAILEDSRVLFCKADKQDKGFQSSTLLDTTMDIDEGLNEQQLKEHEQLQKSNYVTAIGLAGKILQNQKTHSLLRLAQRNLLKPWVMVAGCIQSLETIISDALPKGAVEALSFLLGSFKKGFSQEAASYQFSAVQTLTKSRTFHWSYGNCTGQGHAAAWLPIDIFMEDVMVGTRVIATSVVEALAELVKSLQLIQNVSWHDTFLALLISSVRLAQRIMENIEGHRPLYGSRLSIPLAIVPLALGLLIEEEENFLLVGSEIGNGTGNENDRKQYGKRRAALASSLKVLGQFEDLISIPQKLAAAANLSAMFTNPYSHGNVPFEGISVTDVISGGRAGVNLQHLIVETCIARGLLDTSAYFWPGCVGVIGSNISRSVPTQASPWKVFMDGAPLSASLRSSLVSTPAKSVAELEKMFQIALTGPEEERPAAAVILCSASLMHSWNIQEHAVSLVVRLLCPPAISDGKINSHHLVQHAPMLYATLGAINTTDILHVLSLYGKTFELAAALLPICEVFGSLSPTAPLVAGSKDEMSVLTVFSLAFLILIKICKFHRAPLEYWNTGSGIDLFNKTSLEYLLVRYNLQVAAILGHSGDKKWADDTDGSKKLPSSSSFGDLPGQTISPQYVRMDTFPRLRSWFLQQKSSTISGGISGVASADPVHQIGDRLLTMMLKKATKSGSMPTSSGASVSSTSNDDIGGKPMLPAFDLLAAVPYVIDALLTAYGHGKILPRDLTTGLRELVDFCPATIASIITCLESDMTCGISRPASMNGKDWPSPAANLLSVEAEIRDILSSCGVNLPCCTSGGSNSGNVLVTLPLPLAALLSLTITFKVDKLSDLILSVAGPALQNMAGAAACTSVVAALWSQKVRRWHNFIIFGSSVCAIQRDKKVAAQVLKSCFAATLGMTNNPLTAHGGVGALLGHSNWVQSATAGQQPIPPGILFLRICPSLHDIMFLPSEVLTLLVKSVREVSAVLSENASASLKTGLRLRCLQSSLAETVSRVAQASILSASLLFVSGGSILVELLYTEVLPDWFLSGYREEERVGCSKSGNTALLEGYALAYFSVLSGMLVWGASKSLTKSMPSSPKMATVSSHMKFLASVLGGKKSLACDPATWKAYVRTFISLVLTCASSWISYVDVEILHRIAICLRNWHDYDLALALLESGGSNSMYLAAEFSLHL